MTNITSFLILALVSSTLADKDAAPDPSEKAAMARYIMQEVEWVSMATVSTLKNIAGYPFANLKLVSDGLPENGTGVPYFLMTDLDLSGRDVKVNSKITIMASLAEKSFCDKKHYDPQDPRCPRLIISGKLRKLEDDTEEFTFARKALISKHPIIPTWELVHKFYIATIEMEQICILDAFGGASFVSVDDYLKAMPTKVEKRPRRTHEYTVTLIN